MPSAHTLCESVSSHHIDYQPSGN